MFILVVEVAMAVMRLLFEDVFATIYCIVDAAVVLLLNQRLKKQPMTKMFVLY